MCYVFAKRLIDITASLAGLALLLIPGLVLAAMVYLSLGSPVFFAQERVGLRGKRFCLVKFRTMREADDKDGNPRPDSERLTRLGSFMRAASLDEIPELWNVLRGDMSLVGPRPLLVDYLPYYTPEQMRRHEVRPGITGLAQVRGRNALNWDDKFRHDLEYVDHYSFWLDLNILGATLIKVVSREGIDSAPGVPMPRFDEEVIALRKQLEEKEAGRDE